MQRSLASTAVRTLRAAAPAVRSAPKNARNMSGHGHADLDYWRNVSIAGFGVATLLGAYEYYVHVQHHASGQHFDPELNNYPYMKMRSKSYPWSCADCSLFDQKCWDECKGRGGGHH